MGFFARLFSCCNEQSNLDIKPESSIRHDSRMLHQSDSESGYNHDPFMEQQLQFQGSFADRASSKKSLSRADRVYQEEVRNMLIMLEHYKL
jgi:hypothetical protein